MPAVILVRKPFEISEPVVGLVAVAMIHDRQIAAIFKESHCDEPMHEKLFRRLGPRAGGEENESVAVIVRHLPQNVPALAEVYERLYPALRGNKIAAFVSRHRLPCFLFSYHFVLR